MPAQPTEMCENCTVRRIDLRRCAGCATVRYCSKECQKAHWKSHKPHCQLNASLAAQAAEMGPDYSARLAAIGKWCDMFSVPLGAASASALNLMTYPERADEYVLVICLDFLPGGKAPYTHDIVDAAIVSLSALLTWARSVSLEKAATFEASLAPRPGVIRVLLRDRGFPGSYTTPFVVPSNIKEWLYDPLWFEHLQICVTKPGRKVRAREPGVASPIP
ncbi:hypothetical protein FB451DRAFT_1554123 [Mycena latifolia]|nr:hypothetical protein FB451DRAFT_1554123 [Mycena latifolia]